MRVARKTIHLGPQSFEQYVRQEKQILQKLTGSIGQSGQNDVEAFKEAINKLRETPLALPVTPIMDSYLTIESRKRLGNLKIDIERKLSEKVSEMEKGNSAASIEVAIEDLARDKQAILEVGMRNAKIEKQRLDDLLLTHDKLDRPYLKEEELVLRHYLTSEDVQAVLDARQQISAHLTEKRLLAYVRERAKSDIIELESLLQRLRSLNTEAGNQNRQLDSLNTSLPEKTRDLLRNNPLLNVTEPRVSERQHVVAEQISSFFR
jgi:hypothetical protein